MKKTPDNEGPIGTVPESTDNKSNHKIGIPTEPGAAISPQSDIKIVAKPGGERNVPSLPKFSY